MQLTYESNFIEVFPNLTMILKIDLNCEVKGTFPRHIFLNNYVPVPQLEEALNYSLILYVENYSIILSFVKMWIAKNFREKKVL